LKENFSASREEPPSRSTPEGKEKKYGKGGGCKFNVLHEKVGGISSINNPCEGKRKALAGNAAQEKRHLIKLLPALVKLLPVKSHFYCWGHK